MTDVELASDEQHAALYDLLVSAASELTAEVDDVDRDEEKEAA